MMKTSASKPNRPLESFSPEVLAEFIRANVPMLGVKRVLEVKAELIHIEARQRLESIQKEIDLLIQKGKTEHGNLPAYLKTQDRITELWKEWETAMPIAFPC